MNSGARCGSGRSIKLMSFRIGRNGCFGLNLILKGGMAADGSVENTGAEGLTYNQGRLFETVSTASIDCNGQLFGVKDRPHEALRLFSNTSIEALAEAYPWLQTARVIAERQRFAHYDLLFADVMRERGGFDLIIGNPPWIKPDWNDNDVLGDIDPQFTVKGWSATETNKARAVPEAVTGKLQRYLDAYASRNDYGLHRFADDASLHQRGAEQFLQMLHRSCF